MDSPTAVTEATDMTEAPQRTTVSAISPDELRDRLMRLSRPTWVGVFAVTAVRMNKRLCDGDRNPLYVRVRKRAYVSGIIGRSYQEAVNEGRLREGRPATFATEARKFGRHIPDTPLVEHRGRYYLPIHVQGSSRLGYLLDGKPVEDAVVEPYFRPESASSCWSQRLEQPVIYRDYALDSIYSIGLGDCVLTIPERLRDWYGSEVARAESH